MASPTTNTISSGFAFQSINFGNNLIEIGALMTLMGLIGSIIAETLVLGDRGSAGLVWGTIGTFEAGSIIKACISGAIPGWLQALLELRNKASDLAIGFGLELARDSRVQLEQGVPSMRRWAYLATQRSGLYLFQFKNVPNIPSSENR